MKLYTTYNTVITLTVLVGVLAFALAARSISTALIALPVVISAFLLFRKSLVTPLPRWTLNILLLASLLSLIRGFTGELSEVVPVVGQYIAYLQFIKLLESRTPRDQGQLIALSLILTIGSVLTSVTLDMGIMLIIYVPIVFTAIVLYQVLSGIYKESSARLNTTDTNLIAPVLLNEYLPAQATRSTRRLVATSTLAMLVIAGGVFVLIPRSVGEGFLGSLPQPRSRAVTGFNESIRLGSTTNINESQATVLEVKVIADINNPIVITPPDSRFLLRGSVLDYYDKKSKTWTRATSHTSDTITIGTGTFSEPPDTPAQPTRTRFSINIPITTGRNIFLPWWTVQLDIKDNHAFDFTRRTGTASLKQKKRSLNYTATAFIDQAGAFRVPQNFESTYLNAQSNQPNPFLDTRIQDLAQSIAPNLIAERDPALDTHPNDRRIAQAFVSYLEQTCRYTLAPPIVPADRDPIVYFLFTGREGHCEYFASALAALCRSVGIHARVVAGYVATEYDDQANAYIVRERHAHAWTDVRIGEGIWLELDPSPSESLASLHKPAPTVLSKLRDFIEAIDMFWIDSVVAFDDQRQADIFTQRSEDQWIDAVTEALETGSTEDAGEGASRIAAIAQAIAIALALLSFFILIRLVIKRVRTNQSQLPALASLPEYSTALSLLKEAGFEKPATTPPLIHADDIQQAAPTSAIHFRQIAIHNYSASLDPMHMPQPMQHHLDCLKDALQKERFQNDSRS